MSTKRRLALGTLCLPVNGPTGLSANFFTGAELSKDPTRPVVPQEGSLHLWHYSKTNRLDYKL